MKNQSDANNVSQFTSLQQMEKSLETSDYYLRRLDEEKKIEFEARLKSDRVLQHQLADEEKFANNLNAMDENYTVSKSNFDEFDKQLSLSTSRQQADKTSYSKPYGIAASIAFKTSYSKPYGIAASIALLIFIGFMSNNQLFTESDTNSSEFRTLSNDSEFIDGTSNPLYRVIFSERVEKQTIHSIATKYGFSIVKGPDDKNSYLINVKQPLTDVERGLLRDSEDIVFIEKAVKR